MSIDYINQKLYENELSKQRKMLSPKEEYDNMVVEIRNISKTKGFGQIVGYWKREKELHETRLEQIEDAIAQGKKIDKEHINNVMTSLAVCRKFLMFLVNLLESK